MKKKEYKPILYEKYKAEHEGEGHTGGAEEKRKTSLSRKLGNLVLTVILLFMIILSTVGVVTLMNPVMRTLLINIISG